MKDSASAMPNLRETLAANLPASIPHTFERYVAMSHLRRAFFIVRQPWQVVTGVMPHTVTSTGTSVEVEVREGPGVAVFLPTE